MGNFWIPQVRSSYRSLHSPLDGYGEIWLVVSTPLKNISQLERLFQIYGKIWENKTCSKPPTRNPPFGQVTCHPETSWGTGRARRTAPGTPPVLERHQGSRHLSDMGLFGEFLGYDDHSASFKYGNYSNYNSKTIVSIMITIIVLLWWLL